MKQKAYAAAGVDIDLGNKVKATLPQLLTARIAARCSARSAASAACSRWT